MTWYNYTIAYNGFIADLITKIKAEGWTETEAGYGTVQPAGYSIYYLIDVLTYGSIPELDTGGTSSYNMTYFIIHQRATYNAATHVPTTTANGGDARIRLVYNVDLTAEAVKLMTVKGWIDATHVCLYITSDATQTNRASWILFMGEVEAVGAGADTCMLAAPEILNPVGDGAYAYSYSDPLYESHMIHSLGDGCGYYPIVYGLGGSSLDSKVRPGQVLIWKYQADSTTRAGDIAFRISPSIVRPVIQIGAEAEADTFTDTAPAPDETFTRVPLAKYNSSAYPGYMCWQKINYNSSGCSLAGKGELCWIRSA
jgi:hypothetical protein